ncbi:MAG TPA: acyltransferase [Mycobacteriales bacterium]|nr:acyltransferase [Mycobacteriales bacterium]
MVRRTAMRAVRAARVLGPQARTASTAVRRRAFIARTRVSAAWVNATVELDIADDVRIGRDVRVVFEPWSHNVLHIGPKSSLDDRVLIQLKGGTIRIGDRVEIRRDCVLNVAGELEIDGDGPISWNSVIHCSTRIHLERMVGLAEQVTLADSSHYFTTPDEHFWHNVRTGAIEIGRNTWLCPKVTVTRDAKIGSHCIIGAGSVVVGEIPAGSLASGVPASYRPLSLPW